MTAQPSDDSSVDASAELHAGPQTNRAVRLADIAALALAQDRVVSRRQLRAVGWSDSQIDHEIKYGRWHAPACGVVALQNAPLTYDQRLWLGVLHAGDGAVLTHLTACRRAGLEWKGDDETIHVLTPKGDLVDPIEGFFFHQTRRPTNAGSARCRPDLHGCRSTTPGSLLPNATDTFAVPLGCLPHACSSG